MNTSDGLNRAAEIIMERGHTKGEREDKYGRVCLIGAILKAGVYSHEACRAIRVVIGGDFIEWNDRPETTEAMAIGALHEAAIYAKEHGL